MEDSGGSESDNQPELRQRQRTSEQSSDDKNSEPVTLEPEISASESESATSDKLHSSNDEIAIPRAPRNLRPLPPQPSFLIRQFRAVKNFSIELIEFILLFLTTLFNPMADVNTQVQEHNQRRMAREGRNFGGSSCKPSSSFPGCGPSS